MHIVPTNMTVADYCKAMQEKSLTVNRDYQRSNQVWPHTAQSFLIETILLGYPIPKLSLFQRTDRVSRLTVKEIIDGQQRSEAILQFYEGRLKLSRKLDLTDAAGRSYEQLDDDLQDKFLAYPLGIDLFVEATLEDVREVFRRINSHTVPLNPEEQRHAQYQGDFKWYIYHLAKNHDQLLVDMGVFSEKQIVRMQDMKLFTEITHALIYGISTTNKRSLDKLYKEHDKSFPLGDTLQRKIGDSIAYIGELESIRRTALMKPYNFYSLVLAVLHAVEAEPSLATLGLGGTGASDALRAASELSILAEVAESKVATEGTEEFLKATESRTNVKEQREKRFQFMLEAVAAT